MVEWRGAADGGLIEIRWEPQRFEDSAWAVDGFCDAEESRAWSDRSCGLACLRMVLGHFGLAVPAQSELLWAGLRLGAYCPNGWVHAGLVELAGAHGLTGFARGGVGIAGLVHAVTLGVPPIVSVARSFPGGQRGGHLAVFCGVSTWRGTVWAHFRDPSRWGETNDRVPLDRFEAGFARRACFLWPPGWPVMSAAVGGPVA